MWTLPSPAPAPLPDRIVLVTILVTRKVTRIARNIHIIGCSVRSPRPTGTFTPGGTFTRVGIFTGKASRDAVLAAPTRTASSCAQMRDARIVRARPPGLLLAGHAASWPPTRLA